MANESENDVLAAWETSSQYWNKHQALIEQMFAPLSRKLIEAAGICSGQTVLDIGGGSGERIRSKLITTLVLEKNDSALWMLLEIREVAGHQNVGVTIPIEVGDFSARGAVNREKVALVEIVFAIIFQNSHPMVGLQDTRVIEVVSVHVHNVENSVAVEIVQGEVHGAIDWRKPRQGPLARETAFPVVLEEDDSLVSLSEQRDDVWRSVAGKVNYLEPNRARRGVENFSAVALAVVPVES